MYYFNPFVSGIRHNSTTIPTIPITIPKIIATNVLFFIFFCSFFLYVIFISFRRYKGYPLNVEEAFLFCF